MTCQKGLTLLQLSVTHGIYNLYHVKSTLNCDNERDKL